MKSQRTKVLTTNQFNCSRDSRQGITHSQLAPRLLPVMQVTELLYLLKSKISEILIFLKLKNEFRSDLSQKSKRLEIINKLKV